MKLLTICILSFAFAALLCYGALRVASAIAKASTSRIYLVETLITTDQ